MACAVCGSELIADAVYCPHCGTAVEGAVECEDFAYEAFISYRHLETDRKAAMKLQKAIDELQNAVTPGQITMEDLDGETAKE